MAKDMMDASLVAVAKHLKASSQVKTNECVMSEKRVDVFKGAGAVKALTNTSTYGKLKNVPKINDAKDAQTVLQQMVAEGFFMRVTSVNNTRFVQMDMSREWDDDALYAWIWEGSQFFYLLAGFLTIMAIIAAIMFPLWPFVIRSKVSWVMSWVVKLLIAFIVFLVVISIVRMIFYAITVNTCKRGIWIFPNLWEDVGFFASFWPVWAWEENGPESEKKNQ